MHSGVSSWVNVKVKSWSKLMSSVFINWQTSNDIKGQANILGGGDHLGSQGQGQSCMLVKDDVIWDCSTQGICINIWTLSDQKPTGNFPVWKQTDKQTGRCKTIWLLIQRHENIKSIYKVERQIKWYTYSSKEGQCWRSSSESEFFKMMVQ